MKYFKLFILFLAIVFIAGCKKEYQLYVYDDKIIEKFHMEIDSNNKYTKLYYGKINPLHNDLNHFYEKKLVKKGNNDILDLEYTYTHEEFVNANSFNQCFDERHIFLNDDKYFEIYLAKPNGCMFKESYVINIITDNKVVSNNADTVKGNKYIWHVKNDGSDNDSFKLQFKIKKGSVEKKNKKGYLLGYIIFGIVILILIFAIFITVKRVKRNNNFS